MTENDTFVSSVIGGGVNIFNEIKKFRGSSTTCSSRIDNEVEQSNIATHFANIYTELYNRVELGNELERVSDSTNARITGDSAAQLARVNEETVREPLTIIKGNNHDAMFDIVSDCIIHGPPELVSGNPLEKLEPRIQHSNR